MEIGTAQRSPCPGMLYIGNAHGARQWSHCSLAPQSPECTCSERATGARGFDSGARWPALCLSCA